MKKKDEDLSKGVMIVKKDSEENANVLHVGFLYASPIVFIDGDSQGRKGFQAPEQLDFMSECKMIKDTLKQTNKAIKFQS